VSIFVSAVSNLVEKAAIATRRLSDGTPTCKGGRNRNANRQPHVFRATGITAYLKNAGKLEVAQHIANHESTCLTARTAWS